MPKESEIGWELNLERRTLNYGFCSRFATPSLYAEVSRLSTPSLDTSEFTVQR